MLGAGMGNGVLSGLHGGGLISANGGLLGAGLGTWGVGMGEAQWH